MLFCCSRNGSVHDLQLQVQRTTAIRPTKISKIFLTHAHGDHTFGLPGLLCLMGQDKEHRSPDNPVEIYGPEGLRMYLRVAIRYSVSRIVPPYRVHEIRNVPMAPEWEYNPRTRRHFYRGLPRRGGDSSDKYDARASSPFSSDWGSARGLAGEADPTSWISQANQMHLEPSLLYGEVDGGRDIYPEYGHPLSADGAPVWDIEDQEDVKVYAAPMSHGIPCLGERKSADEVASGSAASHSFTSSPFQSLHPAFVQDTPSSSNPAPADSGVNWWSRSSDVTSMP